MCSYHKLRYFLEADHSREMFRIYDGYFARISLEHEVWNMWIDPHIKIIA